MNKVLKKILNIIIDIIVIVILIISIAVVVISLSTKSSGVPNIFGYAPLSVVSNSMSPTFEEGDLIIGKVLTADNYDVQVGDVVTFPIEINGETVLNTHRVIEKTVDSGLEYYKTQGDNKDSNPVPDKSLQTDATVLAKWTGTRIPGIGGFLSFIRTQLGFFLVILLPMIIFFVYEAIRVVMNIIAYNREKAKEEAIEAVANSELTEEQKQRAIEEYLAKQKSDKEDAPEVQTPAADDNSEADENNEEQT